MRARGYGFTLVEIMIVVAIVGILCLIAVPAVMPALRRSRATVMVSDFRTFAAAFEVYAVENGGYPGEMEGPCFMDPDVGINAYLDKEDFLNSSAFDGAYDWDGPDSHPYYGISVRPWQITDGIAQDADDIMDNGDTATGSMRWLYGGGRYAYILQE